MCVKFLAAFALVLSGTAAYAGDGICKIVVRGPRGEHVRVALKVAEATVVGGDVVWSPAFTLAPSGDASIFQQLDIRYMHAAAADRLGEPGEVGLTFTRQTGEIQDLASVSAQLTTQGGGDWNGTTPAQFQSIYRANFAVHVPEQNVNVNPELLSQIDTLHGATVHLRSAVGQEISSAYFDLSDHSSRDDLIRKAWDQASVRAASPEPCN